MIQDKTLAQAQNELRDKIEKGSICPCCQQFAKVYKRTITSSMAYALILLAKETGMNRTDEDYPYIHAEDFFKALKDIPASVRGDFPKLRFWNLIEPFYMDEELVPGMYKMTKRGFSFVNGTVVVNPIARIYNNKLLSYGKEDKSITIQEALKNKFNYEELMRS